MRWFYGVPCVAGALALAACGATPAPSSSTANTSTSLDSEGIIPADADLTIHVMRKVTALAPPCDNAFSALQKLVPTGSHPKVLAAAQKAYDVCWNGSGDFDEIAIPKSLPSKVQDQLSLAIDQCSNAYADRTGAAEGLVRAKGDLERVDEDGVGYLKFMSEHSNQCVEGMAKAGAMVGLSHQQVADALAGKP